MKRQELYRTLGEYLEVDLSTPSPEFTSLPKVVCQGTDKVLEQVDLNLGNLGIRNSTILVTFLFQDDGNLSTHKIQEVTSGLDENEFSVYTVHEG